MLVSRAGTVSGVFTVSLNSSATTVVNSTLYTIFYFTTPETLTISLMVGTTAPGTVTTSTQAGAATTFIITDAAPSVVNYAASLQVRFTVVDPTGRLKLHAIAGRAASARMS